MWTYDPDELANRPLASGDGVSLIKGLYAKELEMKRLEKIMIDKAAQRARAQSLTAVLASQGMVPPSLPVPAPRKPKATDWPFPVGHPPTPVKAQKYARDQRGEELRVGDTIVFARYGNARLYIAKIASISKTGKTITADNGYTKVASGVVRLNNKV